MMVPAGATVTTIEPGRRGVVRDLLDAWLYRDLLVTLALRDIRVRYRQTTLGVVWVLLQPTMTALIFSAVFGRVAAFDTTPVPYPVFVLAGLVPWPFVSNGVTHAASSILIAEPLIGHLGLDWKPHVEVDPPTSVRPRSTTCVAMRTRGGQRWGGSRRLASKSSSR